MILSMFDIDTFKNPEALWLLIPVALLLIAELFARPHGVVSVSTGELLAEIHAEGAEWVRKIPTIMRTLGLVLLVIAIARPLNGMRPRIESAEVRDIVLAVDVSGSMTANDFEIEGRLRDRLFVTKLAVRDFIESRKADVEDRFGLDRVGLLLYASYAWIQTPLTLDYGLLEHDLAKVSINQNNEKHNRTAIGSAIGLSLSNLLKSEAESKVIILLTDGINNAGELDPITAANLANDYGIRVYTIGAGATSRNALGGQNPIDEDAMKEIAEITGGKYYRATDLETLQQAYQEINELETTEIELGEVFDYDEGFMPWAVLGTFFVLTSVLSRRKWFEAIP
jgi:Ca-activated chloride channel family protein